MEAIDNFKELDEMLTEYLSSQRLRNTAERRTILKVMCEEEEPFEVKDVYISLFIKGEEVSIRTIYYNISIFEAAKIIEKIPTTTNSILYQVCNCDK